MSIGDIFVSIHVLARVFGRVSTCERLYDDLPDDPPGGGGVPLGGRGHARLLLTGLHGVEVVVLTAELVGDVVAGVRVRQPGHVAVRRG